MISVCLNFNLPIIELVRLDPKRIGYPKCFFIIDYLSVAKYALLLHKKNKYLSSKLVVQLALQKFDRNNGDTILVTKKLRTHRC